MERVERKVESNMVELGQGGRVTLCERKEKGEKMKREVKSGVGLGSGNSPPSSLPLAATSRFARIEKHHKPSGRHLSSRPPLESAKRENMETAFAHRLHELAAVMAMDARISEGGVKEEQEQQELKQGQEGQDWVTAGSFHVDEKRRERTLNNWVIYQRVATLVMGAKSTVIRSKERIAKDDLEGRILRLEKRGESKAADAKAKQDKAKDKSKADAVEEKFSGKKFDVTKPHLNINLSKKKAHKSISERPPRFSKRTSVARDPSEGEKRGRPLHPPKAIYKLLHFTIYHHHESKA